MPDTTDVQQLSEAVKKAISEAKGSTAKKVLWWVLGILGVLLSIVGVIAVIKGKGPIKSADDVIQKVKYETDKADFEEKARAAEAAKAEKVVVDKLTEISTIKSEYERMEEYAKLMQH